jgi:hypothetical protein
VVGIAIADPILQITSQHGGYVEHGCRWLNCGCTDAVLRELVINWNLSTPVANAKIISVVRGER